MSGDGKWTDDPEEATRLRLETSMRRFYATQRRSLRWWKHAREYVSLLRLVRGGLLRAEKPVAPLVDPATGESYFRSVSTYGKGWFGPATPTARSWPYNTPDGKAPYRD